MISYLTANNHFTLRIYDILASLSWLEKQAIFNYPPIWSLQACKHEKFQFQKWGDLVLYWIQISSHFFLSLQSCNSSNLNIQFAQGSASKEVILLMAKWGNLNPTEKSTIPKINTCFLIKESLPFTYYRYVSAFIRSHFYSLIIEILVHS